MATGIVTIDMVADLNGWKADSTWTYIVGKSSAATDRLLRVAKQAMMDGIKQALPGNYIAVFQRLRIREAVAYNIVDGRAGCVWIPFEPFLSRRGPLSSMNRSTKRSISRVVTPGASRLDNVSDLRELIPERGGGDVNFCTICLRYCR